jgi:hypothetical protein
VLTLADSSAMPKIGIAEESFVGHEKGAARMLRAAPC